MTEATFQARPANSLQLARISWSLDEGRALLHDALCKTTYVTHVIFKMHISYNNVAEGCDIGGSLWTSLTYTGNCASR
jgi:hypothetical protein